MCSKINCNEDNYRDIPQVNLSLCKTCTLEFTCYIMDNEIKKDDYRDYLYRFINNELGDTSIFNERNDDDDYDFWVIGAF